MADKKYAGPDLRSLGVTHSSSLDELYRLYGVTGYATNSSDHNTWYKLSSSEWLQAVTYNTLYDQLKDTFFIKDHFSSSLHDLSWLTIHNQAAGAYLHPGRDIPLSPTNQMSDRPIYRLISGQEVIALQYNSPIYGTLYYIHPDYISEHDLGWHTISELNALGYAFDIDEYQIPLYFKNTGNTTATIKLTKQGSVRDLDYETSTDGINWTSYTVPDYVDSEVDSITIEPGQCVYFRGSHGEQTILNFLQFIMSGTISAYGNINSLLYKDNFRSATSVGNGAFALLFANCASLHRAPLLPATTVGSYAYIGMFYNCTSLSAPPILPATSFTGSLNYKSMFAGCTALTSMPDLPAMNLTNEIYNSMFLGCSSLNTARDLPATTLTEGCYEGMFYGCVALQKAPIIHAITPAYTCFCEMFSGCTSLNEVHCKLIRESNQSQLIAAQWLENVAPSGDFYCDDINFWPIDNSGGIPENWAIHVEMPLCFVNTGSQSATIALNNVLGNNGVSLSSKSYQYSYGPDYTDESTWKTYSFNGNNGDVKTLAAGQKIFFRGNRSTQSETSWMQFSLQSSRHIKAYGNTNSILSSSNYNASNIISSNGSFALYRLFKECDSLYRAPSLPARVLSNYCYRALLQSCTNLVYAPVLPKPNRAYYMGYSMMFDTCTSLQYAPELPLKDLSTDNYFYFYMFSNCTNLVNPPVLPATKLGRGSYQGMFEGCTVLATAPSLPATDLSSDCYYSMFEGCAALDTPPDLPAITLYSDCYNSMFKRCNHLEMMPDLPATTLASYCYAHMFENCTSLTSTTVLPAKTLVNYCYTYMFSGCSNLSEVYCNAEEIQSGSNATSNWLYLVAAHGDLYCYNTNLFATNSSSGIPSGWSSWLYKPLCFENVSSTNAFVKLYQYSSVDLHPNYKISRDGYTWEPYTIGTNVELNDLLGKTVFFKGSKDNTGDSQSDNDNNMRFAMSTTSTVEIKASGNVNSMLSQNSKVFAKIRDLTSYGKYCFRNLFANCTRMISPPALPATTLTDNCYGFMFYMCKALKYAPRLPAMNLASTCYCRMFDTCESLEDATTLSAVTLAHACYDGMFSNCGSLQNIPSNLPATTLTPYCYRDMFANCTSLEVAPTLPATTLANYCYQGMFSGCTSLTDAPKYLNVPDLPATVLASSCYRNMFGGCTSLTIAPRLPAESLVGYCYNNMFYGCTSLNEVKCFALSNGNYSTATTDWLTGVPNNGHFYCYAKPVYVSGTFYAFDQWRGSAHDNYNGIPSTWNKHILREYHTAYTHLGTRDRITIGNECDFDSKSDTIHAHGEYGNLFYNELVTDTMVGNTRVCTSDKFVITGATSDTSTQPNITYLHVCGITDSGCIKLMSGSTDGDMIWPQSIATVDYYVDLANIHLHNTVGQAVQGCLDSPKIQYIVLCDQLDAFMITDRGLCITYSKPDNLDEDDLTSNSITVYDISNGDTAVGLAYPTAVLDNVSVLARGMSGPNADGYITVAGNPSNGGWFDISGVFTDRLNELNWPTAIKSLIPQNKVIKYNESRLPANTV